MQSTPAKTHNVACDIQKALVTNPNNTYNLSDGLQPTSDGLQPNDRLVYYLWDILRSDAYDGMIGHSCSLHVSLQRAFLAADKTKLETQTRRMERHKRATRSNWPYN